ncbi:nucleotidyltransferase domain-containing protein [Desulfomicrobium escambiense]|uniref:nucleotidyltransferase domain-containing protein n=1 Tax=Desulfomicrobium escambiense TaxID=29503 RepID=UPI00041E4A28|nr:nucleotidyltransferase domain-containing protein [Desulfomicrobium escambiense]
MERLNKESRQTLERIANAILSAFNVDAIYLYGSRARGTGRPESDWDIGILFSEYASDPVERALRPQEVETILERELHMYDRISVVDVEQVPPPLQWNIIRGMRFFDRGVPRVRRVEASIVSTVEKDYAHAG